MRTRFFPLSLLAFAGPLLGACADATAPAANAAADAPAAVRARFDCTADVRSGTVSCAQPDAQGRAAKDVLLGSQRVNTQIITGPPSVSADTFAFDLSVKNLMQVAIGTTDGSTPDSDGVQVLIANGITTTQGTGAVTPANADGTGTFTASNQPYWAYHQIIPPDSTSSARRWKFQFDPGVQFFTFTLYVNAPFPPGSGSVHLTIVSPSASSVQGDSVRVTARIDSASATVASVEASAGGRTVVLSSTALGVLTGTLDLTGLPAQTLQLRVRGTTVTGDTGVAVVSFIKDAPPTLSIVSPHYGLVARPSAAIDVDCTDDDPSGCTSVVATVSVQSVAGTDTVATGTTSIHTTVSLASFDEKSLRVTLTGTDARNQAASVIVSPVYVETAPALTLLDSAGVGALDVDSTRLLYARAGDVAIHDRAAGTRDSAAVPVLGVYGYLHPQGAILAAKPSPTALVPHVYDWRAGTVTDVSDLGSDNSLTVAGTWATWPSWTPRYSLYRRDLTTGTNVTVAASAGNTGDDVASNGDVVYWTYAGTDAYDVFRYRGGTTTRITDDPDTAHWNVYPVTDGTNILYFHTDQHGRSSLQGGSIMLANGSGGEALAGAGTDVEPHVSYEANNGWIAWLQSDGGGITQVHTRSPDGVSRTATSAAANTFIRALGPDGTVVFGDRTSLYVTRAPYTAAPVRLFADQYGMVKFRGTQLILLLGNSAFNVSY